MKCSNPLHLKHWGGPSLLHDRLLSEDGDQPLSVPLDFSHFCSAEVSFLGGEVTVLSALHTLCGPGVGGWHVGSLLGRSSGPNLARIWSIIWVPSDS